MNVQGEYNEDREQVGNEESVLDFSDFSDFLWFLNRHKTRETRISEMSVPLHMSSRHRSPNAVLRVVAAKMEWSLTFSNASFRSHVCYIMQVDCRDLTRSRSTLRPQAHENTDPTFIFIPTAHFLFLLSRECLLAGASLCLGGAVQRFFLPESQHGPLVTDISLLRTQLLYKPHIAPCITPDYDHLEANMTNSWWTKKMSFTWTVGIYVLFFFFWNPNLYPALVQLGTEADTYTTYYV